VTVANIPELAPPDNDEKTAIGFFNISSDADGVLRRSLLVLPFGRTNNPDDFDLCWFPSRRWCISHSYAGGG
jgi:CHASE2 domain-containing sensor protein